MSFLRMCREFDCAENGVVQSTVAPADHCRQRVEVQDKRLAFEQSLSASNQSHCKELSYDLTNQARLWDRMITSDLQLSVVLAEDPASGC